MLTLKSPAKVNLFLRVVGRRADGYHNLASLFQVISLFDVIHFVLNDFDSLTCTDPTIPTDASNLICKAVKLFRQKVGINFGLRVHLEKNIPHQAGLGGGSSNAATTLWALNELLGHPATIDDLLHWSAELGSDVPFFFSHGTAYCTGRGEIVRPLQPPPQKLFWVVKPDFGLSTPHVFQQLQFDKLLQRDPERSLAECLSGNLSLFNDLEEPAFALSPELELMKKELLGSGFSSVVMTGSGSAFMCFGEGKIIPSETTKRFFEVNFVNREVGSWYNPTKTLSQ